MSIIKKRVFYVCSYVGLDSRGNPIYSEPKEFKAVIAPVSGNHDILALGDRTFKMFRCLLPYESFMDIKEKDKVYLHEGIKFKDEKPYGMSANYSVYSVRPQNLKTIVYFEKITKKGFNE